ncbi:unnamed protein product, partial [Oikopleura dioica]
DRRRANETRNGRRTVQKRKYRLCGEPVGRI